MSREVFEHTLLSECGCHMYTGDIATATPHLAGQRSLNQCPFGRIEIMDSAVISQICLPAWVPQVTLCSLIDKIKSHNKIPTFVRDFISTGSIVLAFYSQGHSETQISE